MKKLIELILQKDPSRPTLSLFFALNDSSVAQRYWHLLRLMHQQPNLVSDPDRLYHFPGDHRDKTWIADRLNQVIATINHHSPGLIQESASPAMPQMVLNQLHKHFEVLRGSLVSPSEFFLSAPAPVQEALHHFNLLIHRFEDAARLAELPVERRQAQARIVLGFKRNDQMALELGDYQHFTKRNVFGHWYLDYFELGKPLWDLYLDQDKVVGEDNIRPQRFMSANALIHCGATDSARAVTRKLAGFRAWWEQEAAFLEHLGFTWGDPRNAIGSIPVAKLIRTRGKVAGLSQQQINRLIGRHGVLQGIKLHGAGVEGKKKAPLHGALLSTKRDSKSLSK